MRNGINFPSRIVQRQSNDINSLNRCILMMEIDKFSRIFIISICNVYHLKIGLTCSECSLYIFHFWKRIFEYFMKMPNTKRIVLNIPKLQLPRYICRIEMSFEHRYYSWGNTISHDLSSCKYSTRFSIIIKHCIHLRNQPREKKNIFHPWKEIFWHKYSSNKLKSYSIKFVQFYVLPCGSSFMLVWERKKNRYWRQFWNGMVLPVIENCFDLRNFLM